MPLPLENKQAALYNILAAMNNAHFDEVALIEIAAPTVVVVAAKYCNEYITPRDPDALCYVVAKTDIGEFGIVLYNDGMAALDLTETGVTADDFDPEINKQLPAPMPPTKGDVGLIAVTPDVLVLTALLLAKVKIKRLEEGLKMVKVSLGGTTN